MAEKSPFERLTGRGMYPVEYAFGLLSPLRSVIVPAARIADRLALRPADRVLEIGCGPGFFSPALARRLPEGHLTILDAQQGMLDIALKRMRTRGLGNVRAVQGQAEKLPFADAAFNTVFMVTVLGEIDAPSAAMAEVARVLVPGGLLSVTEQWGDPDRLRRPRIDALAQGAGFGADRVWPGFFSETVNYRKKF